MYLDYKVKIPDSGNGITRKTIKGITYIYYSYGRDYNAEKKYTVPKNTTIGKCSEGDQDMMYPNTNFLKFFPEVELPEAKSMASRSGCLRIGAFLVIRKIIAEYHLDEIIDRLIGKDSGLFLDLAAYSMIAENNAGQYYPDYAFNHPLFTDRMKIYSDTKVSDFINSITRDQSIAFQNEWNNTRDHREKIYISYDSTNKNCQSGDLDFVEFGHAKDDKGQPVLNFSIAYDHDNSVPLFYEEYPGSIVDISQLQLMLEKANGYGYQHVGFILDRGYFCQENIRCMDKCGYDFVIMMKGKKELVKSLVAEVKGTFEESREHSIRDYKVSGITVKRQLYPSDEKERYFHIYYDDRKKSSEREAVEAKIDRMAEFLQTHEGTKLDPGQNFAKYFDLVYYHKGKEDEKFECARELYPVIDEEIRLCGYFVIITSEKMTAEEALDLYKSRDASEKLFRGDKSYLGNRSFRVQSNESLHAKIFIEFVALIIRNRFHRCLKEQMSSSDKKYNYMTVPAAIRELEKIELIRQSDRSYRLDHAVTAAQKEILKAFHMTAKNISEQAAGINDDLAKSN
jgi:transposase